MDRAPTTFAELLAAEAERVALRAWSERVAAAGFVPITEPWRPAPLERPLPPPAVRRERGRTG